MTAAQRLCDQAGMTMKEVCKRAQVSPARFKLLARNGNAPDFTAERICSVLGDSCDPMIFIWGYDAWRQMRQEIEAASHKERGSGDATLAAGGQRNDTRRRHCPRDSNILTLVD